MKAKWWNQLKLTMLALMGGILLLTGCAETNTEQIDTESAAEEQIENRAQSVGNHHNETDENAPKKIESKEIESFYMETGKSTSSYHNVSINIKKDSSEDLYDCIFYGKMGGEYFEYDFTMDETMLSLLQDLIDEYDIAANNGVIDYTDALPPDNVHVLSIHYESGEFIYMKADYCPFEELVTPACMLLEDIAKGEIRNELPIYDADEDVHESEEQESFEEYDDSYEDNYAVTVSSIEELLDAIGPGRSITIEPGVYNITDYLDTVEPQQWNETHTYVRLEECYDGTEIVIDRVTDLSIQAAEDEFVEIVTEPRYAAVLNFERCYEIYLNGITMGHTDTGNCVGNVLNFNNCHNLILNQMDLYGCGVYGIGAENGTGAMYVYNSVIRECAFGPLDIYDAVGAFEFYDCVLKDSEGLGYFEASDYCYLYFNGCTFGDYETYAYQNDPDVTTEDCIFSSNELHFESGL